MYRLAIAASFSLILSTPITTFGQASNVPQSPSMSSTAADARAAMQDGYKSPGTATLISVIVPGGGSMYADHVGKGAAILGAYFGSYLVAIGGASQGNTGTTLVGLGGAVASWVYGMVTAGGDARAYNATLGQRAELPVEPVVQVAANGRTNFGLRLAFGH